MSRAKVTQIDKTAKQLVSNIIKVIYKQQSILPYFSDRSILLFLRLIYTLRELLRQSTQPPIGLERDILF